MVGLSVDDRIPVQLSRHVSAIGSVTVTLANSAGSAERRKQPAVSNEGVDLKQDSPVIDRRPLTRGTNAVSRRPVRGGHTHAPVTVVKVIAVKLSSLGRRRRKSAYRVTLLFHNRICPRTLIGSEDTQSIVNKETTCNEI